MLSMANVWQFPIAVRFAGLQGNTLEMIRGGWEFTLMESPARSYNREFRFYGHHKGLRLRCASAPLFPEREAVRFQDWLVNAEAPILIEGMAQSIEIAAPEFLEGKVQRWDGTVGLDRATFETGVPFGLSHGPGMSFTLARRALDHLAKFTSIDDGADIFVPKNEIWTVEKHLTAIREIQEPLQKEIRKRLVAEGEVQKLVQPNTRIYLVS